MDGLALVYRALESCASLHFDQEPYFFRSECSVLAGGAAGEGHARAPANGGGQAERKYRGGGK
jgi:hypothetical protein